MFMLLLLRSLDLYCLMFKPRLLFSSIVVSLILLVFVMAMADIGCMYVCMDVVILYVAWINTMMINDDSCQWQ